MCLLERSRTILGLEITENYSGYEQYAEMNMRAYRPIPYQPRDIVHEVWDGMHRRIDPPNNWFSDDNSIRLHHYLRKKDQTRKTLPASISIRKTINCKIREYNKKHNIRRPPMIQLDDLQLPLVHNQLPLAHKPMFDALEHCMDLLTEDARQVLQMAYIDKLPRTKIAVRKDRTIYQTRQTLARVIRQLAKCIRDQLDN